MAAYVSRFTASRSSSAAAAEASFACANSPLLLTLGAVLAASIFVIPAVLLITLSGILGLIVISVLVARGSCRLKDLCRLP